MTRVLTLGTVLLAAGVWLAGCGDGGGAAGGAPHIDSLSPASGPTGAQVDIVGVRFCGPEATDVKADDSCTAPPAGQVTFATPEPPGEEPDAGLAAAKVDRAQVVSWKGTRVQVNVPAALEPGSVKVVVTVNGVASNARDFSVE